MMLALRQTAKEILAAAVCELFPGTLLIGGAVDELGFSYDFLFQRNIIPVFSQNELFQIEDRMRLMIYEKRAIEHKEMMRENGAMFLRHLKQELRAQEASELAENVISIFKMGEFYDLASPPFLGNSYDVRAFQLIDFSLIPIDDEICIRIYGTAFQDKKELKDFLKRYKIGLKKSFSVRGPEENFFLPLDSQGSEEWILLPKGERLYQRFADYWRNSHLEQGFFFLMPPKKILAKDAHAVAHERIKVPRTASLDLENGDFATIWCQEKEVVNELISSLHFIERTFKIFGFEMHISLVCSNAKRKILKNALDAAKLHYQVEERITERPGIEFRATDCLGRELCLSHLALDGNQEGVIYRCLFYSLQKWLALCIEHEKE